MIWRHALPEYEFQGLDGQQESLSDRPAGPLLINLWATWCRPCLAELQEFTERKNEFEESGLQVLLLNVDGAAPDVEPDAEKSRAFIDRLGIPYRVGLVDGYLMKRITALQEREMNKYAGDVVPISLLVDSQNRLAVIYRGPVTVDQLLADLAWIDKDAETVRDWALPLKGRWHRPPTDGAE